MNRGEAFLTCRCGACRMTLCDPNMRYRTECMCSDCRQRGLISASRRAGNELPAAVAAFERGIDLFYFTNALRVDDESLGLLEFSKLRDDADNTTAMSSCCGTLMCGRHPSYEGTTISVNADSCRVTVPTTMPNQAYVFGCDIPADKYTALELDEGVPMVYSWEQDADSDALAALIAAVTVPVPERYRSDDCTSFEQLCATKTVSIDNTYFEQSRAATR